MHAFEALCLVILVKCCHQMSKSVIWILTNLMKPRVLVLSPVCSTIEVSNAWFQKSREGTYDLLEMRSCFGRHTWQQRGSVNYNHLYFYGVDNAWNGWIIGTMPCTNSGGGSLSLFPFCPSSLWQHPGVQPGEQLRWRLRGHGPILHLFWPPHLEAEGLPPE